jgi:hypothetical protein
MNERIKALAEQAGIQMFEDRAFGWSVIAGTDHNVQRFAELIVSECATLIPAEQSHAPNGQSMLKIFQEHFEVEK